MKTYMATVQLLVTAKSEAEACDGISEMFGVTMFPEPHEDWPFLADWAYLKIGGQYLSPVEKWLDLENYEEGDFTS